MTVTIRTATADDADAIASVHIASWRETYRGLLPDDVLEELRYGDRVALWRKAIAAADQSSTRTQIVAETGGQIVGFGACGPGRSKDCIEAGFMGEIYALYILASHQSSGLGSSLFRRLAGHLVGEGVVSASLWVLDTNIRARRFYERHGGTAFSEREDDDHGCVTTIIGYGWHDLTLLQSQNRAAWFDE